MSEPASVTVLVIETYADVYAVALLERFPTLRILAARNAGDVPARLGEVDVLVAFGLSVSDDMLRAASRLGWIQSLATGVDHFLRCPSLRPETLLTSGRGIHGPAMREMAAYLMLALSHDARRLMRNQTDRWWDRSKPWPLLAGKTATIVGTGVSAVAIAELLKAFGMHVVGVTRTPRPIEGFDSVVATPALIAAAADADYLIGVLPSTPENARLLDARIFAAMKPTAYFVNIGRGETVDEKALLDCLREGRIAEAALDVFATEPLPADSPFWDLPNALVTSHISGLFVEYEEYVMPILLHNMDCFLRGDRTGMRNLVAH